MRVSSQAFGEGQTIPKTYTCEGADTNPPLVISDLPPDAQEVVLIMDDPDAPGGTFTHWIVSNLPAGKEIRIAENDVPPGAVQGANSAGQDRYMGPCPPNGVHRYRFTAYALRRKSALNPEADRAMVDAKLAGTGGSIEQATLTGVYEKTGRTTNG